MEKHISSIPFSEASARLQKLGSEFLVVNNPDYVHPPFEIYPLTPRINSLDGRPPAAVVMDMDGTTTTTETLCIHSLETMVRRVTGRTDDNEWKGLDPDRDYPHIIGNSTTKHVEYLIKTYGDALSEKDTAAALLNAAAWTLAEGKDSKRKEEVSATLKALGWSGLTDTGFFRELVSADPFTGCSSVSDMPEGWADRLDLQSFPSRVRAAIDIYYHRYHEILSMLAQGQDSAVSEELLDGRQSIEPMPGVTEFLLLIRGEIAPDTEEILYERLMPFTGPYSPEEEAEKKAMLEKLTAMFRDHPSKAAVVTSSIRYEADIVLDELFSVIREQAADLVGKDKAESVFSTPYSFYDAVITASDSSEIRLKPHRDLYSIALHSMGIMPGDFGRVIGFEDSESGTQAIRAAGIGLCAAVPFSDTAGHDLSAAVHVLKGGLPEAILDKGLFVWGT